MDGVQLQGTDGPLVVKVAEIGFTSNKRSPLKKSWPSAHNSVSDYSFPPNYAYESYGPGELIYSFVEPNMSLPHYVPMANAMSPIMNHGQYPLNHAHISMPCLPIEAHRSFGYKEIITVKVTNLPSEIVDASFLLDLLSRYQSNFVSANIEDGLGDNNRRVGVIYIEGMQYAQYVTSALNGAVLFEGAPPIKVYQVLSF